MDRKTFLRASGLLIPASLWGISPNRIGEKAVVESVDAGVPYLNSASYKAHADKLRFKADGTFKIVQFTDVHWVPDNPASEEAAERMNEVLDAERPDFVIYTGDVVFAKPATKAYLRAIEPVLSRKLPFAVTLGNHEN